MKHLIVGIDPGKTAAFACLDLDGNIVSIETMRFGGLEWFVDYIKRKGTPVVVACDKKRADQLIGKLAAIFDAALFLPATDISVQKKKEFSEGCMVRNLHERDALTAAKVAYNSYVNKLHQAERLAKEKGIEDTDRIKAMVIKKSSIYESMTNSNAGSRFVRSA